MSGPPGAPTGFVRVDGPEGWLFVMTDRAPGLVAAGLNAVEAWRQAVGHRRTAPGRGASAVMRPSGSPPLRLKQLRRGGLLAGYNDDRFRGSDRLLDNLRLPREAIERGIPTPSAAALLLLPAGDSEYRGWLAVDEVEDAVDLARRAAAADSLTDRELAGVAGLLRGMHDQGLDHRDLNLGNLLLTPDSALVIDLDGGRLAEGPLPGADRRRALWRLERSLHKEAYRHAGEPVFSMDALLDRYAGDDRAMRATVARHRGVGRFLIGLHRLGWRR